MLEFFFSAFLPLLLVIDPFANTIPFLAYTRHLSPERRRFVILRECIAGTVLLVISALIGSYLLRYLGVSTDTLTITGGVLLFIIGLEMLFKGDAGLSHDEGESPEALGERKSEPFLVPLAIPLFAGPASIALTVANAGPGAENRWLWVTGMLCACGVSTLILVKSDLLLRRLGAVAMSALGRLMGLALTAMAIQMILNGFKVYWTALPAR